MALRIKNVAAGYMDAHGFHPIRSSPDYDSDYVSRRTGESVLDDYGSRSDGTGLRYARGHKPKAKKRAVKRKPVKRTATKRAAPKRTAVKRKNPYYIAGIGKKDARYPNTHWEFEVGGVPVKMADSIGPVAAMGIATRLVKVHRQTVTVYLNGRVYARESKHSGTGTQTRYAKYSENPHGNPSLASLIPSTRWVTAKVKMVGKELKMLLPGVRGRKR